MFLLRYIFNTSSLCLGCPPHSRGVLPLPPERQDWSRHWQITGEDPGLFYWLPAPVQPIVWKSCSGAWPDDINEMRKKQTVNLSSDFLLLCNHDCVNSFTPLYVVKSPHEFSLMTLPLLHYGWWRHLSQRNPFHKPWPAARQDYNDTFYYPKRK